ncbi:MAG: hypothetical protein ACRCYV_04115 [Aeromonas sp.]
MAAVIIFCVLMSGYFFVVNAPRQRYRYKRADGWHAYFFVAAWGCGFMFASWLICTLINLGDGWRWIANQWSVTPKHIGQMIGFIGEPMNSASADAKAVAVPLLALCLAFVGGWGVRLFARPEYQWRALAQVVEPGSFEFMLLLATAQQQPLLVTLDSKKVYVGLVLCPALEHGEIEQIGLIPLLSGYRDKDELTLHITTSYKKHYEQGGDMDEFLVVVPTASIKSLSRFNLDTYQSFKT